MNTFPISQDFGLWIEAESDNTLAGLDKTWVFERLATNGLLLFRGFAGDERDFIQLTERWGSGFLVHHNKDGRNYIDDDLTIATVAKSKKPIDFHTEMASNPVKPDVLWFYCVAPAVRKGRIGFVDGRTVLKNLTDRTRKVLQDSGFKYSFNKLPQNIWQPVWSNVVGPHRADLSRAERLMRRLGRDRGVFNVQLDDDGLLSFEYAVAPIFRSPLSGQEVFACGLLDNPKRTFMGDGKPVERDVLVEVIQATYQNAVWVDWQSGDLAIVDNTRIMHSREAFEDDQRKVLVRYSIYKPGNVRRRHRSSSNRRSAVTA
jgi:alpha-ketoglutarate-dependent taurine dioxygenase